MPEFVLIIITKV